MSTEALVSIVTPFYNTVNGLSECIESVLRQTYSNWEYILVDNYSDDGSSDIAARYASQCKKIRLVHTDSFLSQVQNYNFALSLIDPGSRYCKLVQADDWIYPECIERLVALAESDDSVGIVSSYRLKGNDVLGGGLPYRRAVLPGTEVCRKQLTQPVFVFGTPTTVLYRSEIVRNTSQFYDEKNFFDDTDAAYRTLQSWNFGFVHQVLSFSRKDDDSIRGKIVDFCPDLLEKLLELTKFGPTCLEHTELAEILSKTRADYYRLLARHWLIESSGPFWEFHRSCLSAAGLHIHTKLLAKNILTEFLQLLAHPRLACKWVLSKLRPKHQKAVGDDRLRSSASQDTIVKC